MPTNKPLSTPRSDKEMHKRFVEAGYRKYPVPPQDKMIQFCLYKCDGLAKKGSKFYCKHIFCPQSQRKKYATFLVYQKVLRNEHNRLVEYDKYIKEIRDIQAKLKHGKDKFRRQAADQAQDIANAYRNMSLRQLRITRFHIDKMLKSITGRIKKLETETPTIPKGLVTQLMSEEIKHLNRENMLCEVKIKHIEQQKQQTLKNIRNWHSFDTLMEPLQQGKGRKPARPADTGAYLESLDKAACEVMELTGEEDSIDPDTEADTETD